MENVNNASRFYHEGVQDVSSNTNSYSFKRVEGHDARWMPGIYSTAMRSTQHQFLEAQLPNNVHILNKEIYQLEQNIDKSTRKIQDLEEFIQKLKNETIPNYIIIGAIGKSIFNKVKADVAKNTRAQMMSLIEQKQAYTDQQRIVENRLTVLAQLRTLQTLDEPEKIFTLEHQIRTQLEAKTRDDPAMRQIYEQHILPLSKKVKQSIIKTPHHFAAKAAASKGKALQAGLQAIQQLANKTPAITSNVSSAQEVFVLPKEGAVFKISGARAKEEEQIVNALFDLMTKEGVVGTFQINKSENKTLGIHVSEDLQRRGVTPNAISPELMNSIKSRLASSLDHQVLEHHLTNKPNVHPELTNYKKIAQQQWYVKMPGKEAESISFLDLQGLNTADHLPLEALVGENVASLRPLQEHLFLNTPLFRAMNYFPSIHGPGGDSLYLTPDFSDPEHKQCYELCEKFEWSYRDTAGRTQITDFKTLHTLWLEDENQVRNFQPISSSSTPSEPPNDFEAMWALLIPWKAVSTQLLKVEKNQISPLTQVQVKPFVSEMILMSDLDPLTREKLLQRMTPDAEFNAVLTGEVQLLDLHSQNLGVAPEQNADYERFKDLRFSVIDNDLPNKKNTSMSFKDLMINYIDGRLKDTTLLSFEENGQRFETSIEHLPELHQALNVRWQFVIFDTDLSMSEDNRLQVQTNQGVEEHLIPFRSVLLETDWKNQPLHQETVRRLLDSAERDLRVENWIKKADAPLYQNLSKETKSVIQKLIAPHLERFTLGGPRKEGKDVTIKDLRGSFAAGLSDITKAGHLKIWETIEHALSSVTVTPNDTWETLSKRHNQDVQTLRKLNPSGLNPGKKIKIPFDVTSNSRDAELKRYEIASQLYPRITLRQQNALLDRQHQRRDYLVNYQNLANSTLTGSALEEQIIRFIQHPSTPLSYVQKQDNLAFIGKSNNGMKEARLLSLKSELIDRCKPTYFNLMKAMYPLLSDAYELNYYLYNTNQNTGGSIGNYLKPLEDSIRSAQTFFSPETKAYRLAAHLKRQIRSIQDPAFFGHW